MMVTCNFHAYKKEGYKAFLIPMDYMEQNRNPNIGYHSIKKGIIDGCKPYKHKDSRHTHTHEWCRIRGFQSPRERMVWGTYHHNIPSHVHDHVYKKVRRK